jgi:hypothetical protein
MTQYWSYLTNKQENNFLTFESHTDIEKMKSDYAELVEFNFFNSFEGYSKIFISNKNPVDNPIETKLFELNFLN